MQEETCSVAGGETTKRSYDCNLGCETEKQQPISKTFFPSATKLRNCLAPVQEVFILTKPASFFPCNPLTNEDQKPAKGCAHATHSENREGQNNNLPSSFGTVLTQQTQQKGTCAHKPSHSGGVELTQHPSLSLSFPLAVPRP